MPFSYSKIYTRSLLSCLLSCFPNLMQSLLQPATTSHPFFDFFLTLIIASLSSVNASVNFFIYLPRLSNHPLLLFSTISTFYVIGVKCFSNLKFTVSHFSSVTVQAVFFFFFFGRGWRGGQKYRDCKVCKDSQFSVINMWNFDQILCNCPPAPFLICGTQQSTFQ